MLVIYRVVSRTLTTHHLFSFLFFSFFLSLSLSSSSVKNEHMNWVGVEWDDHTRGKHDGWLAGVGGGERYFSCEMGAGSFVKAQKLQLSRDFVEVMRERYDHGGEEESVINSVGTLRGKSKPIILVGMDKVAVSFYFFF